MTPVQIMDAIREALRRDTRPQKEIAQASHIHPVNLSQFKAGKRDLPLESLFNLAAVLGLTISVSRPKRRRS